MSTNSLIIRFSDHAAQPSQALGDDPVSIQRLVGFVEARHLIGLFHPDSLRPNPRSAKAGKVTADIRDTLDRTPELFHYKSKGLLLGAAHVVALQRSRFELRLEDPTLEGVLDGGHNLLAIGLHMLAEVMEDDKAHKRIKDWRGFCEAWAEHGPTVDAIKAQFDFLVPVELLIPTSQDEDVVDKFLSALGDICAARNNNAQLPDEAKANKRGFYDPLRERLPAAIAARTAWKPGEVEDADEDKPIKPRDHVALAWIPLNLLSAHKALPIDLSVTPQNIYRNKGECSNLFDRLMEDAAVTEVGEGGRHVLTHDGVKSAFDVFARLPDLYDQIYEEFPDAYNEGSGGKFARNKIVKIYDPAARKAARSSGKDPSSYTATAPVAPFTRREIRRGRSGDRPCSYPDGLIMPLIYGLQGLMVVEEDRVRWAVEDPGTFVRQTLPRIAGQYKLVLDMARWDPQKVAKNPASHEFAVQQFRMALMSHGLAA